MHQSSSAVHPTDNQHVGAPPVSLIGNALKVVPEHGDPALGSTINLQRHGSIEREVLGRFAISVVALGCITWAIWLVLLSVYPNATVNRIMKTESYDNGSFWLLIDPTASMKYASVIGFAIVLAGYLFILLKVTIWRNQAMVVPSSASRFESAHRMIDSLKSTVHDSIARIERDPMRRQLTKLAARFFMDMAVETSQTRKYVSVWIKVFDLALQLTLLMQCLENGYPVVLIYLLAAIVALNATACALMMCVKRFQTELFQVLVDCMFDFLIAVGFPMVVVVYCLSTFEFDSEKLAINTSIFPPGQFERQARVIANPVQVANVLTSLNSLRIRSALSFFTRVGTNLALCHQFSRLVNASRKPTDKHQSVYPRRHPVALLFVVVPIVIAVFVSKSIGTSELVCLPHPECIVHAFRWTKIREGDKTQCPCLTLIDEEVAPKTFAEWLMPKNVTEKVTQLASTGDLQTLQLTNRYLPELPAELRRCTNMKHISLFYTHTETLPTWAKEFTKLEYLHIEGKLFVSSLSSLPDDLFDDMDLLTTIHLGVHIMLKHLPIFRGLVNLRSLTLALLLQLEELPVFTSLSNLEQLTLAVMPTMDAFPDMAPLTNLIDFVIAYRGTMCCNGFLDNRCDPSMPICAIHAIWEDPVIHCLPVNRTDKIATDATRRAFAKFPASVCADSPYNQAQSINFPSPEDSAQCNGTLYRQCVRPGNVTGICYNPRMMPILCDISGFPVEIRKRQILEKVGDPCNPEVEAWLGCQPE